MYSLQDILAKREDEVNPALIDILGLILECCQSILVRFHDASSFPVPAQPKRKKAR